MLDDEDTKNRIIITDIIIRENISPTPEYLVRLNMTPLMPQSNKESERERGRERQREEERERAR